MGQGSEEGESLSQHRVVCKDCSLAQLCIPTGMEGEKLDALDSIIRRRRPIKRGEHLFYIGTPVQSIYAVRSGSVKSYSPTEDGQEQVTGFHLPGELIGLDLVNCETHPVAAKALETTSLCEIPFAQLGELHKRVPALQGQLISVMAKELEHHRELFLTLGKKSAEERLAGFLVNLAERYSHRGLSSRDFYLSMSRNDIANYLGLAVETVSRLFTRFQEERLLSVERKHVRVLDMERLHGLARRTRGGRPSPYGSRRSAEKRLLTTVERLAAGV